MERRLYVSQQQNPQPPGLLSGWLSMADTIRKILSVDQDRATVLLYAGGLSERGYEVFMCEDG